MVPIIIPPIDDPPKRMRKVYRSDDEIRSAWYKLLGEKTGRYMDMMESTDYLAQLGENKELFPPTVIAEYREVPKRVKAFIAEFDPVKAYPEAFWKYHLDLSNGRNWRERWGTSGMFTASHGIRDAFVHMLAFSIPTTEALDEITQFAGTDPIYEYMAGSGYWAFLLDREKGKPVIASDRGQSAYGVSKGKAFVPMLREDTRKATPASGATIMLSWVPYESNHADPLLMKMHPGQKLIFISEGEGGCCAADSTFVILNEQFEEVKDVPVSQFHGLHDRIMLYRKK